MIIDHKQTVRWFTFTAYRIQLRQPMYYIFVSKNRAIQAGFFLSPFCGKTLLWLNSRRKKCLHKDRRTTILSFPSGFFLSFGPHYVNDSLTGSDRFHAHRRRKQMHSLLSTGISHACQLAAWRECVKHQHMVRLENACDTIMFNSFFFLRENMKKTIAECSNNLFWKIYLYCGYKHAH